MRSAKALKKPLMVLPAGLLKLALGFARPLRLTRYGPEQVRFLQYRPVLDNTALKAEFGYTPELIEPANVRTLAQGGGIVSRVAVITGGAGGFGQAFARKTGRG
jgi:hypothetical protein